MQRKPRKLRVLSLTIANSIISKSFKSILLNSLILNVNNTNFSIKRNDVSRISKKFSTFASSFGTMFGNNRECASFLVKIAKSKTKNTRGTEQLIYVGCQPCVYSGVWRYLQGCKAAVHVLFTNKHCINSPIVCPRRAL